MKLSRPLFYTAIVLTAVVLTSCDNTPVINVPQEGSNNYKENMINANKVIAQSEHTQITNYIERHGWQMTQLSNGEWIEEYQKGKGSPISYEDSCHVRYRLEALNGKVIYDGQEETFVVGRNQTTVGLDRAVMEFRRGSKARIIAPSDLGYGVAGDGDRVPSRTVLIYDLEVL